MRVTKAWWLVLFSLGLLVACGGGGGGGGVAGGGGGNQPPAQDTPLTGRLSVLSAQGDQAAAAANTEVRLVVLSDQGQPTSVLARTTTDAQGRFSAPLPAGRSLGPMLGWVADNGSGGQWRALALATEVELGPASESLVAEVLEALGPTRVAAAGHPRLVDFYRNATTALLLRNPRSAVPATAVQGLREWLRSDPASRDALAQLSASGRIDATLGDVGGLFGLVESALAYSDTDLGSRIVLAQPVASAPGRWTLSFFAVGQRPGDDVTRLQLADDAVTQLSTYVPDTTSQVLLQLIGPHKTESFRWAPGVDQLLTNRETPTTGYDFDGDRIEDRLQYQVSQRVVGVESLEVFGQQVRTLRVDYVNDLRVTYSAGGSVSVRGVEKRWHLPGVGPVRSESTTTTTDRQGRVTTVDSTQQVTRAVVAGVSWPGGVRVTRMPLSLPAGYDFPRVLGLTAQQQLVVSGAVFLQCCTAHLGLAVRPLQAAAPSADLLLPPGFLSPRATLSPDGTRIYVATSQTPPGGGSGIAPMPADAAAALGAEVVRYDARSLQEEARFRLPPIASQFRPGMAFPRYLVRSMLVSPRDATEFVAAGVDAVLMRGAASAPLALSGFGAETADAPSVLSDQIRLLGWDGDRQELRYEVNGGGPRSRAAPFTAAGLDARLARESVPVMFLLARRLDSEALYDRVDRRFIHLDGYRQLVDADTGSELANLAARPLTPAGSGSCTRRTLDLVCFTGDQLFLLDPGTLQPQRTLSLNNDLRVLLGDSGLAAAPTLLSAPDGSLVYATFASQAPGQATDAAVRLSFD